MSQHEGRRKTYISLMQGHEDRRNIYIYIYTYMYIYVTQLYISYHHLFIFLPLSLHTRHKPHLKNHDAQSTRHGTRMNELCVRQQMCEITHLYVIFCKRALYLPRKSRIPRKSLTLSYRVAKTHKITYLYRSFSAKVTYI